MHFWRCRTHNASPADAWLTRSFAHIVLYLGIVVWMGVLGLPGAGPFSTECVQLGLVYVGAGTARRSGNCSLWKIGLLNKSHRSHVTDCVDIL